MLAILMNSLRLKHKKRSRSELKVSTLDCCRTCLGTEDLHPIFLELDKETKSATELFLLTGLEVKINDGLPQNLCKTCETIITVAMKFRRMSQKAYKTLYSTVAKAKRKALPKLKLKKEQDCLFDPDYEDFDKIGIDKVYIPCGNGADAEENIPIVDFKATEHKEESAADELITDYDGYDDSYYDDYKESEVSKDVKKPAKAAKKKKLKEPTNYKCNVCHKDFGMKNTYRAHMRFHNNYCVCELCGKKCRNNNLLLLHKRGKHGAERIHKCSYCEYAAANKEGLVIHERRHTGEKPYVCDHCGASFHRRSNLVQHIAIHLPEKKFQCNICSKKFQSKKFLGSHKFKQHQEKRYTYVCHICKNHFRTTDSTRKHILRAHGVPRAAQGPVYRIPNVNNKKGLVHD